jgi:hypothetical protein
MRYRIEGAIAALDVVQGRTAAFDLIRRDPNRQRPNSSDAAPQSRRDKTRLRRRQS